MKTKWENWKNAWWEFWGIYENDDNFIQHLSRSDKKSIWFGSFIMCTFTVAICMLSIGINNIWNERQYEQDVENTLNMIAAYFATATKDEYDEIAQTIRHDLVFSKYGKDMENLIQYIPNTSKNCPTCRESYSSQAYLTCVNSGEQYSLDLNYNGENPNEKAGGTFLSFGYDEISKTNIYVTTHLEAKKGCAKIHRGEKIISAQKMKSVFCDNCIMKILNTIDGQPLEEVVLFDAEQKNFYPIEYGTAVQIGNQEMTISYDCGDFKIDIEQVSK